MRRRVGALRGWLREQASAGARLISGVVGVLLAVGLTGILLLPSLGGEGGLETDEPSPRNVEAPRDLSFESVVLTQDRRRAASDGVSAIFRELDHGVRRTQAERAASVLDLVRRLRDQAVPIDDARRDLSVVPELNEGSDLGGALLMLDEPTFREVARQVPAVVDSTMRLPIRPDSLATARTSVLAYVESGLSPSTEDVIAQVARRFIRPNILVDEEATEASRAAASAAVDPVIHKVSQGEMIVREGQRVSTLQRETLTALGLISDGPGWRLALAMAALATSLVVVSGMTLARLQPGYWNHPRRLTMACLLLLGFALAATVVVPDRTVMGFAFPAAALAMTLVVFAGLESAVLAAAVLAIVIGMAAPPRIDGLEAMVFVFVGSLAAAVTLGRVDRLKSFLSAGLVLLLANVLTLIAFRFPSNAIDLRGALELAGAATANATLATGLAALGVLAAGSLFGVTTSLQLLELARPDHPLLRDLQVKAPGTYQHSIVVGNLAERAAGVLGADALLVRVGAYYHDVGKIEHPYFFVENQLSGRSPHAGLSPQASAKIILDHVTRGAAIARKAGLPEPIIDFILQHHGTTRVEYFYRQAVQESPEGASGVLARSFRYAGPRPQTREAALLMLADGSEAAVRASSPDSAADIDAIVERIIESRLTAGQLDDCEITLRDLRRVRRSFVQTLRSMYHPRIQYPDGPSSAPSAASAGPTPAAGDALAGAEGEPPTSQEPRVGYDAIDPDAIASISAAILKDGGNDEA